jgi:hypothetical protein
MMGYYSNLLVKDQFPVNTFNNTLVKLTQDFFAPFWIFTRSEYSLSYQGMDDALMQTNIRLRSVVKARIGKQNLKTLECELFIGPVGLERYMIHEDKQSIEVRLVNE